MEFQRGNRPARDVLLVAQRFIAGSGLRRNRSPGRDGWIYNQLVTTLREYRPEDFDVLWQLDQRCFEDGISYGEAELRHYLERSSSFTLVAEEGNKIIGFLVADRDRRGFGHIITIDVDPKFRRHGVGATLMKATEDKLRDSGCKSVLLETAVNNMAALAFYKAHGYSVLKTIPRYYLNSIDALLMGKKIAAATPVSTPAATR